MIQGQCPQCGKYLTSTDGNCSYCGWKQLYSSESTFIPVEYNFISVDYHFIPTEQVYYYAPSWIQYWTPAVEYD